MAHHVRVAERDPKRLGDALVSIREQLRLTQEEFAARAGVALKTLQRIELGRTVPRGKTLNRIDDTAGWEPGHARRLLEGDMPPSVDPVDVAHEWSAAERARMRDLSWAEVRETYEVFRQKSEYLAEVWMREVLRVKTEAEQAKIATETATER